MKRLDIEGVGVLVEIYRRDDKKTDLEVLKEAQKAITRKIILLQPVVAEGD